MLEDKRTIEAESVETVMAELGRKARKAARQMATATAERKHAALVAMADSVWRNRNAILDANAIDMAAAEDKETAPAFLDRLKLD